MRVYRSLAAACAIGICALGVHARAQSAADKAKATGLFKQGVADMVAGRFDDGCPRIEESLQLDRQPGTLFTLAECEASRDHIKTAVALYKEYLEWYQKMPSAQQNTQGKRQQTAQQQVGELGPQVPEITLTLPSNAPAGTVVTLDDTVLKAGEIGRPLQVNPGWRTVTTKAPGGELAKTRVTLKRGAKQQVTLSVTAPPSSPAASAVPSSSPAASSSSAPPAPPASSTPAAPRASASSTPPPAPAASSAPPAASSAAVVPPPAPSVAPPPQLPAGPPPPKGTPRIHIVTKQPVTMIATSQIGNRVINQPACQAPCDQIIDGRPGQSFFFVGEGIPESSRFQLRDKAGDVNVHVVPGSSAVRTGGIALTPMGTLGTVASIPIVIIGTNADSTGAQAAGGILLGVGVTALVSGIVMIVKSGTDYQFRSAQTPGVIRF